MIERLFIVGLLVFLMVSLVVTINAVMDKMEGCEEKIKKLDQEVDCLKIQILSCPGKFVEEENQ